MINFNLTNTSALTKQLIEESDSNLLPCLSETQIKIINLDETDKLSSQDLASIILEDYGLISKVLNTVNTFYFNRWGTYISTITKAVIILGFNTIRDIALSMAIIDLIPKENKEIITEIIAKSFCAAYLAEKLISEFETQKREEIFLGALFTNLSRVFLALYNLDTYKHVRHLEQHGAYEDKRLIKRMWKEISTKVIEKWNLPKNLLTFMEDVKSLEKSPKAESKKIIREIYSFIDNSIDLRLDESKKNLSNLHELTKVKSNTILNHLNDSIKNTLVCSPDFKTSLDKINVNLLTDKDSDVKVLKKDDSATSGLLKGITTDSTEKETIFWQLFGQLTAYNINETNSLGHLYLLAMEVFHKGVGFDNVLCCLLRFDKKSIIVRYGIGLKAKYFKEVINMPFPSEQKSIKDAFDMRKDVILKWKDILKALPEKSEIAETDVCLSPLIVSEKPIGCFLLSKDKITENDLQKVISIKNFINLIATNR